MGYTDCCLGWPVRKQRVARSESAAFTREKTSKMGGWNLRNSYCLTLMTVAHVLGEIAHFLINASAREVTGESIFK